MRRVTSCLAALVILSVALSPDVLAQESGAKKPNILFIMGDDIGWMQPSCYHRGLMVGETPNIDRIAAEGGMFMTYYAESSCTAGRCAFITGMQANSNRESLITFIGAEVAGVRWRSFNDQSGRMRTNLYMELENWGVHEWLGYSAASSLFAEGWSDIPRARCTITR